MKIVDLIMSIVAYVATYIGYIFVLGVVIAAISASIVWLITDEDCPTPDSDNGYEAGFYDCIDCVAEGGDYELCKKLYLYYGEDIPAHNVVPPAGVPSEPVPDDWQQKFNDLETDYEWRIARLRMVIDDLIYESQQRADDLETEYMRSETEQLSDADIE